MERFAGAHRVSHLWFSRTGARVGRASVGRPVGHEPRRYDALEPDALEQPVLAAARTPIVPTRTDESAIKGTERISKNFKSSSRR
ncbi:hypothetical protein [Streptomyces sp. NPDC001980]|uniref:hypothetical protein n=1 Tax=Streptomyces sp. NPDC001980 TaxID=3157126 RepID=UPI00332E314E